MEIQSNQPDFEKRCNAARAGAAVSIVADVYGAPARFLTALPPSVPMQYKNGWVLLGWPESAEVVDLGNGKFRVRVPR